jgi:hypothetical protein
VPPWHVSSLIVVSRPGVMGRDVGDLTLGRLAEWRFSIPDRALFRKIAHFVAFEHLPFIRSEETRLQTSGQVGGIMMPILGARSAMKEA